MRVLIINISISISIGIGISIGIDTQPEDRQKLLWSYPFFLPVKAWIYESSSSTH